MPPNASAENSDKNSIISGTTTNNNNNNNNKATITSNYLRRLSLFSGSGANSSPLSPISGLFGSTAGEHDEGQQSKKQLTTMAKAQSNNGTTICQRCKLFEVDLTNTSDDLSATDAELKASRQVISLLQRQLELSRVEKAGLEKLIISQSSNLLDASPSPPHPHSAENLIQLAVSQPASKQLNQSHSSCDIRSETETGAEIKTDNGPNQDQVESRADMLLNLIRTQLYVKDEEIVKLKYSLKEALNDKEQLILQLHMIEGDFAKLKSENTILNENLALRDQTIVSLSNEVFQQSSNSTESSAISTRRQSSAEAFGAQLSSFKAQRHVAKLIDTLDAYKKTNELLSTNVMKLTDRCTRAEKKEIETRSQCHELEAKCCQIQSKLLSLLKEIEQSSKQPSATSTDASQQQQQKQHQEFICSESVKLLIKRLLEDKSLDIPLSWKEGNRSNKDGKEDNRSSNFKYECDELGFYILIDDEEDKVKSSSPSRARDSSNRLNLSRKSSGNLPKVEEGIEVGEEFFADRECSRKGISRQVSVDATKGDEASWHLRWDNFIKDFDKIDLTKSRQFKFLLRSGVPQEYRCKIWKALVNLRISKERERYGPDYYQSLLEPNRPQSSGATYKKPLNPSSKQIELDLLRTLPNNKHFETLDSSGTVRLRRVLIAYSEHNPKVGYCQGMNRLAAVALLVLPEEEAFWCLVTIIENIMPQGYYNDLWLAQVDSNVVMDFLAIKMPNLSDHFKQHSVDLSLFAWFLTIFVDGTPPALFLRLWDSFLYEGDKILFRVALALLRMYESDLLKLNNSVAINNFLRTTVNAPMDVDQFFDIAFDWINPLSTRSLKAKRQHNFQQLRSEFEGSRSTGSSLEHHYKTDSINQVEDSSIISI